MPHKPILVGFLAVFALIALPDGSSASVTNTRITSGPSGTIFTDSATFTFESPEGDVFLCRLDPWEHTIWTPWGPWAPWYPCTSPQTYSSLADGPHRFEVSALNHSGHPDPTPAVRAFTVETDTEPPETTITSGPSGTIATGSASFEFESTEPGSFECRLDSSEESGWETCVSPQSYSSLADGPHTFEVRASDEAGNTDPTPATATFAVDTTPPVTPTPAVATVAADTGPPKPVAGQTFDLEPVEGNVELQCPGEGSYSKLVGFKQVPVGCLINTRHGVVDLTASKGSSGDLQGAHFWGGVFIATQDAGDNQEVGLKLAGKRMCERRDPTKGPVARVSRKGGGGRKLWGSGKGNYSTSGSYGSATVRGTTWLVVDRCDASTLVKVAEGTVLVRDFVKDRSLTLTTGEQYIAKASIPRLDPDALP